MDKFATLISSALILGLSVPPVMAADALVDMGTIASYGDPANALRRIGPEARRGNARAEALLGYMYEHGLGVPQSWPAAVDYYLLAAEQGDATGQISARPDVRQGVRRFARRRAGLQVAESRGGPRSEEQPRVFLAGFATPSLPR